MRGAGDFFGEMSLPAGQPHSATVRAAGDAQLYERTKEAVAPVLRDHRELPAKLAAVAADRNRPPCLRS